MLGTAAVFGGRESLAIGGPGGSAARLPPPPAVCCPCVRPRPSHVALPHAFCGPCCRAGPAAAGVHAAGAALAHSGRRAIARSVACHRGIYAANVATGQQRLDQLAPPRQRGREGGREGGRESEREREMGQGGRPGRAHNEDRQGGREGG